MHMSAVLSITCPDSNVFHQHVGQPSMWATPPKRVKLISSHQLCLYTNVRKPLTKKVDIFLLYKRFNQSRSKAIVRQLEYTKSHVQLSNAAFKVFSPTTRQLLSTSS
jgi:hypothetical protein